MTWTDQLQPFTLRLHTETSTFYVPFLIISPSTSDVRVIQAVLAAEYRRLILEDGERQPACWQ